MDKISDARCKKNSYREAIYIEKYPPPYDGEVPYVLDDTWIWFDDDCIAIEAELDELFNTVIGFDYEHDPFKK